VCGITRWLCRALFFVKRFWERLRVLDGVDGVDGVDKSDGSDRSDR